MRRILIAVFLLSACLFPASAGASEKAPPMDVQLWPGAEAGKLVVIVSATLPQSSELPAVVRVPVIEGMSVTWAGEIADSGAGEDVQHEATATAGSYVEVPLEKFRTAQVELVGESLKVSGSTHSTSVRFFQTVPAEVTSFSVRLPSGVSEVRITPAPAGAASRNDAGETLYTLPSAELTAGKSQVITVSYSTGTPASRGESGAQASTNTVLGVLLGAVVFAIVALVAVLAKQRTAR